MMTYSQLKITVPGWQTKATYHWHPDQPNHRKDRLAVLWRLWHRDKIISFEEFLCRIIMEKGIYYRRDKNGL